MSPGSLIPDRQLTFSPDLAATIGLEPAILLQGIGPSIPRSPGRWHALVLSALEKQFPFWSGDRIRQLLQELADLGIIALLPGDDRNSVRVAAATTSPHSERPPEPQPPQNWQPAESVLDLLSLNHGIDRAFSMQQLASFERGAADHTRDSRFRQHVLSAWRRQQRQHPAFDISTPPPFDSQWQPSADALEIMTRGGVDPEFIDSIRPEFILYWRERGGPPREVNSKFIGYVRGRWTRYQAGLAHSTEPRPMTRDWQPHEQVYEVLAMAGIERSYASERLAEFVLYWCDSGDLNTSWNSKFLQHVKHQWRWQQGQEKANGGQQTGSTGGAAGRTRDRSIADDLSDTSWAN